MPEFRFQFQYTPGDLKVIREATGSVRFSPATTIKVWACGFVVSLLMLGAIGSWTVLAMSFVVAALFLAIYVYRLNRSSFSDRETLVRTITLSDTGVVEEWGDSMYEKSWGVFEEFVDTSDHLILKHYEKMTVVPKRSIPDDELDECRAYIHKQFELDFKHPLANFEKWFKTGFGFPVFKFRWQNDEIKSLVNAKLQVFNPGSPQTSFGKNQGRRTVWGVCMVFVGLILLALAVAPDAFAAGDFGWVRGLLVLIAISVPFVVALIWWNYTSYMAKRKTPRIPDEDIYVTVNEESLMIGYQRAIARFSWKDISAVYFSDRFIGFRPNNGMVHVIANHAFGGKEEALKFLRLADRLRLSCDPENAATIQYVAADESDNPYKPPHYS